MSAAFWQRLKRTVRRLLSPRRATPYADGFAWAQAECAEKGIFAYEVIIRFAEENHHPFARGAVDAATKYKAERTAHLAQGASAHG